MSAAIAHARGILAMLHPASPNAGRTWLSLIGGTCGLSLASSALDGDGVGSRLLGAMMLFAATAGLSGVQQALWSPGTGHLIPLPIGKITRRVVELVFYLVLAVAIALPMTAAMAMVQAQASLSTTTDEPMVVVISVWVSLAKATMLVAPLLVAIVPGETRHGPIALPRLLLPWLPVGVAASAGWLAEPSGLLLTLVVMGCIAGILLALRSTGWEDWWPRLPDLYRNSARVRDRMMPEARTATDHRSGLRNGIGWGLSLSAFAWLIVLATSRGIIREDWNVASLLLIAAAFIAGAYSSMDIPLAARLRPWRAGAVPWSVLPLPHGEMRKRIQSGQSLTWLVLAIVQLLALWGVYFGLAGSRTELISAELVVGMLLPMIPVLIVFEAFYTNASRPAGLIPGVIITILGFGTVMLPLIIATELLGGLPGTIAPASLSAVAATQRLLAGVGPAFLIGLLWLGAGRLLVLRDIARQR